MGRALQIRNADFSNIAIGNVNNDIGNPNWVLGIHDYMNEFGNGGQFNKTVLWFGEAFTGGVSFFSGKTFSKFICRFQESQHGTENIGTTANVHIGYCDVEGGNFVELTHVTALYNTVMEFNEPITIPVGKTLYVYITNMWVKTIGNEIIEQLQIPKGLNFLENNEVHSLLNTCMMFDIFEVETN